MSPEEAKEIRSGGRGDLGYRDLGQAEGRGVYRDLHARLETGAGKGRSVACPGRGSGPSTTRGVDGKSGEGRGKLQCSFWRPRARTMSAS